MLVVLNLTIGIATPSSEQRAASATQGDVDNEMYPRQSLHRFDAAGTVR
jgi:hypothetical protein